MTKKYIGKVIRVAYASFDPERDHVDVRLRDGSIVSAYRCEVSELEGCGQFLPLHVGDITCNRCGHGEHSHDHGH